VADRAALVTTTRQTSSSISRKGQRKDQKQQPSAPASTATAAAGDQGRQAVQQSATGEGSGGNLEMNQAAVDRKAQLKGLKMVYYHYTTCPECKWQHNFSQASNFSQLSLNFSIIGGLLINLSAKGSECALLCAVFVLCRSGASCTCTCSIWISLHEASPAKVIPSQAPLPCNPCHCKHSPLAKQCCSS
jgi:hypothetical protein